VWHEAFRITVALLLLQSALFAQQTTFEHVKIRRHKSVQGRVLVDKVGVLTFDDRRQALTFRDGAGDKLDIGAANVQPGIKVVGNSVRNSGFSLGDRDQGEYFALDGVKCRRKENPRRVTRESYSAAK
jgi:hypothetical protein